MILETAQLLSTAVWHHAPQQARLWGLYRPTHRNHPVTLWVKHSESNYRWTTDLLYHLLREREFRTNKTHATQIYLRRLTDGVEFIPWAKPIPSPNCSAYPEVEHFLAYRLTLRDKWVNDIRTPTWTKRGSPEWLKKISDLDC
jgi:hypothetical protein